MYAFDYGKLERAIGALTARGVKSLNKINSERFGIASHRVRYGVCLGIKGWDRR